MVVCDSEVKALFESCGALLNGHFRLASGLHSPQYLEKFRVLECPELTTWLCAEIADRFVDANVQIVVGPATGGIILAYEVARQIGARALFTESVGGNMKLRRGFVRALFTERAGGQMKLRRGFTIDPAEHVLIVEDIITTGGSVREVMEIVRSLSAELVGVALLCDRSNGALDLGVRTEALLKLAIAAYGPEECPQCHDGVPLSER